MYSSPRIEVSNSADQLSIYSTGSRAPSRERNPSPDIRRRSPSPVPSPSPSPHPSPAVGVQLSLTLPPPAPIEGRISSSSDASSVTLDGKTALMSPESTLCPDTVLGGPVTAEPEGLTATPESTPVQEDLKVYLSAAPVSFAANNRYTHRATIDFNKLESFAKIPARNGLVPRPNCVGTLGWQPHAHPEGSLYFSYKNFFTNVYLYDKQNLRIIEKTVQLVTKEMEVQGIPEDSTDIGLETLIDDEGDILGCYYLCDRKEEEAFYLTEVDEGFFTDIVNAKILGRDHLKLAAEAAYWEHVFMFPHGRELSCEALDQLHSELGYYVVDKETSKTSTAPWSADDLHRFLNISRDIPMPRQNSTVARPEHMALIARIRYGLARERFLRYHGQQCAQLDSDRSVYEPPDIKHTSWFWLFSWLFFFTPQIYFDRLSKVWVDHKVNYQHWRKFIGELQEDWTASITPATVILTTNVGFLAIQTVDQNGTASPDRTAAQIVSYVSTMLSIGNIIACVILARQHRPSSHHYAEDAVAYLAQRAQTTGGLEKLAIIFSIPTAFFIWALLTFTIAMAWVCFSETSAVTRAAVGITIALSAVFLGGIVHNGDWSAPPKDTNTLSNKVTRMRQLIQKAPKLAALRLRTLSQDAAARIGDLRLVERLRSSSLTLRARSGSDSFTGMGSGPETPKKARKRSPRQVSFSPESLRYDEKRPQYSPMGDNLV